MMTKYLKLRSTHIIVKCILGLIILSLILSTISNYINQDIEKYIVTVNGEKISFRTFQNMYVMEREKQKKILGKNFFKLNKNKKFIEDTYNYVISQLINNVLLEQYTKKNQLQKNDNQVKEIILNSPIFQKNKKFNKELYFSYLESINLTNHEYINMINTKINTQNLIYTIANSNFILENEQKNIINLLSQKRIIKKSIFKIHSLTYKPKITNSEAEKYFYKHKSHFYIPEQFKIDFFQLKLKKFKTECNNTEINEWYSNNIKKYSTEEKRRYSIIQIKNKNEALSILSKLHKKPKDFTKIARKQSIDPISSKKGGDIGWISINLIPNEIRDANLHQKNQISNIIPFHNEFLIIQLNDIKSKQQKKISEVYQIIKKEIQNKKSLDMYHKLKNEISRSIKNTPNQLYSILQKNNIPVQKTNWFNKYSIPEILNIPALKKIIFNQKVMFKNKKLRKKLYFIKFKNHQSFLIKIKDFKNKKMQNFSSVKKIIFKQLKFIKSAKKIKEKSEEIINELKKGNTHLLKQFNLYFTDPEILSRYDKNPLSPIVFSLPHPKKEKKIYTLYQDKDKNCIIISLEKVYNEKFFQKENNTVIKYLEKNNTEIIFNSLIKDLREKSIITYEKIKNI